jgi:IS5 family transposase
LATLKAISELVNWDELVAIVRILDKTQTGKGGRPPISFEVKLKMLFLQYMFNLSDEELEGEMIDRLSFQEFAGLSFNEKIPDFTTIWYFKEGLIKKQLKDKIFVTIVSQIEKHGLILKKGTMVDAKIIESGNRPLSKKKRVKLVKKPSSQIDVEAESTVKNGKKYLDIKNILGLMWKVKSSGKGRLHRKRQNKMQKRVLN